ncbi:molybdate ABC transporter permease subunit [Parvibaculaceae bacterium PLY_AMNH_Bact1]|nr:molybdate ABC transporter permease subunit [Parvibaculaceae bacterium PLY_AMNH_Bact1]
MLELTNAEWVALSLSLKVALTGVIVSLPLGFVVAWVLARKNFPGKIILDGLVHLPLVVPPVATGYLLLVLLGINGPFGAWLNDQFGLRLVFTWQGAAIVAAVMGFPLLVRALRLSIEAIDTGLIHAARTLGASPSRVFVTIILPLVSPGLIAGSLLAFSRALGEFGATIAFVGNIPGETQTLPLALYSALQSPGGEEMGYRLVALSIVLAVVTLAASELLGRAVRKRLTGDA